MSGQKTARHPEHYTLGATFRKFFSCGGSITNNGTKLSLWQAAGLKGYRILMNQSQKFSSRGFLPG
jgi:hypothetical protein